MIIEILSLANQIHDLVTKFNLYKEAGVGEYWVIFPYAQISEVYLLKKRQVQIGQKVFGR